MTKFILGAKSFIKTPKGRDEEVMTYVSEDGKQGVQFHGHPTRAFAWILLRQHNMSLSEIDRVINAYCEAGLKQHDFKGGYDEAIQTVSI